jgi:hypothetical protein
MKIALEKQQAELLKGFLDQLGSFRLDNKIKKALRVFHNSVDVEAATVNVDSWRFREALPFVKWAFNQAQVGFNRSYGITKIRWWKWALLPWALFEYAFLVVPFMRRKQAEMAVIAAAVTQVEEAVVRQEHNK